MQLKLDESADEVLLTYDSRSSALSVLRDFRQELLEGTFGDCADVLSAGIR